MNELYASNLFEVSEMQRANEISFESLDHIQEFLIAAEITTFEVVT